MKLIQNKGVAGILRCSCTVKRVARYFASDGAHRETPPWRIMFFGTDSFSLKHLKVLHKTPQIVERLEVTVPFNKCPVASFASEVGLTTHKWPLRGPDTTFDVGVIVSFGHLIPENVIRCFPHGILNIHPSMLPKLRGAAPMVHTLLAGDRETGVTVMDISASRFDVGPMLIQESFGVPEDCSALQLEDIAAEHGSRLLIHCLQNLKSIERCSQEGKPTFAKKLKKENSRINWDKQTAHHIDRQFRAISMGVAPETRDQRNTRPIGLRTKWQGQTARLQDMLSRSEMQDPLIEDYLRKDEERLGAIKPGFLIYHKTAKVLCVKCKTGWAAFRTIAVNKPLSALDFYNGYLKSDKKDAHFESQENGLDGYWND